MDTKGHTIVLASGSPRRQQFFNEMKIPYIKKVIPVEENFPSTLSGFAIAEHIVAQKANAFKNTIKDNEIIITADTIVWHQNKYLGKPTSIQNAEEILKTLSDDTHQVITAVGFLQKKTWECINVVSEVTFGPVSKKQSKSILPQAPQWIKQVHMAFRTYLALYILNQSLEVILIS